VIAIDNGGRTDCTVWGDILTAVARSRGVAGTVIHGCCRDTTRIMELGYPVFSVSSYMKSGKNRARFIGAQRPIHLSGTLVQPGDLLVGDDSGVLCIPAGAAARVLEIAKRIEAMEGTILKELADGVPLREARKRHNYNQFSFQKS